MRLIPMVLFLAIPALAWGQNAATGPLDPLEFARLKSYGAYRSSSNNLYVDSNDDSKHPIPGETVVLADLQGPGIVNHIWITIADSEYAWPRLLRVRVYYDGHKTPSVDVPLGDFFGVGHGYERNLNSMMVRNASFGRARNSYWPMPFRKSCKITLTNEGRRRVTSFYYHVDWQKHDSLPEDIGYFHAHYRQATPPPAGKLYTLLNIRGVGHYVGSVLNIIQTQMGWFGEGDEMFYVDDEPTPRIEGTGTEDYFNDAWALRVSDGAWTGIPVAEGEGYGARLTGVRWHGTDPVPFQKSLRVAIEHFGWTYNADGTARSGFEERSDFFSSVAFWYQKGVNEDLPEPPYGAARLPFSNALQVEVEDNRKEATAEQGEVSVQKEVFWSKDILFLKAQGPGAIVNIPFEAPRDGYYEVIAQIAQAPDYGDYVATLDGKQTNSTLITWGPLQAQAPPPEIIHNYQPEIFVGIDHRLGWFKLSKGRHILSFKCVGKDKLATGYNLGVDGIVLAEIENGEALVNATGEGLPRYETVEDAIPARAPATGVVYRGEPLSFYTNRLKQAPREARAQVVRSIGAFEEAAAPAINDLSTALSDSDPEVRAAAAWALSRVGSGASRAAPDVARLLKDVSLPVRESATLALREMGKGAAVAVPELSAALRDAAGTVRMSAALALGAMGEAATPAVPALQAAILRSIGPDISAENIQVVRNICYALGDIGPGARSAIPALRSVQHLRIKYIAEAAIAKIEGRPTPTWH
jgi:hypothetical protein